MAEINAKQLEAWALGLEKNDPKLMELSVELLEQVFPVLDAWSRKQSLTLCGTEIGAKHCLSTHMRNVWRAIVVGNFVDQNKITAQREQNFNWQRLQTSLIASVVGNDQESTQTATNKDSPKKQVSKWDQLVLRIKGVSAIFASAFRTHSPLSYTFAELYYLLVGFWPRLQSRTNAASFTALLFRPGSDAKKLVYLGSRKLKWRIEVVRSIGRKREIEDYSDQIDMEQFGQSIWQKIRNRTDIGPTSKNLLCEAIRNWIRALPPFWSKVLAAKELIQGMKKQGDYCFMGHPDMSLDYLSAMEACNQLNIPTIEFQHGVPHLRYTHIMQFTWRNHPNYYLTFGQFANYEPSDDSLKQRVVKIVNQPIAFIPGYFMRTYFYNRQTRKLLASQLKKRVLFMSYFCGDGDLCEYPISDKALQLQEVAFISKAVLVDDLEITIKIRPGSEHKIVDYLPKEVLEKVSILDVPMKAAHFTISKYDMVASCYYSTALLEACSIGVFAMFIPSEVEKTIIPPHIIEAMQASKREIYLASSIEDALVVLRQPLPENSGEQQAFGSGYARYCDYSSLVDLAERLERIFRTHSAVTSISPKDIVESELRYERYSGLDENNLFEDVPRN